jgi:uncharacterized BrkB/YihY/UPF0761 family membrane protein
MIGRAQHVSRRVRSSATEAGDWLQRQRAQDRRVEYALAAFERDRSTGGSVLAGAVAFRLFMFFVPYVVFVLLLLGTGSGPTAADRDVARQLGIGGLVASAAEGTNHLSGWERFTSLVLLAYGIFWGARVLYRVLHIVFSLEWSVPVTRVKATKPALGVVGFVTVTLFAEFGLSRLRAVSPIGGPIGAILFLVLPAVFWLFMLQYLPHAPECPWWWQLPGALLIAIGIEVIHLITIYWIAYQITSKSNLYGGLGSALAILLWAYLIGRLIVFAAVINMLIWQTFTTSRPTAAPTPEHPDRTPDQLELGGGTDQQRDQADASRDESP